jgi:perosamine synthetase
MIPIFKPFYGKEEEDAVIEVLRSGWLGLGPKTEQFEKLFAQKVGAKYAVSVNSATSALLIAARILGVSPGDEVIVPTITFVSTAHIVSHLGAIPVFCDINETNLTIDWNDAKSKITKRTKLIIPVLYGGQPIDTPNLGITVLYDCAHATGIRWSVSNKVCCWSFHAVKNLSTGEGGMITTDDEEIYKQAKILRLLGINRDTWDRFNKIPYSWEYDVGVIGYKANGNDILNAIGISQLKKLDIGQKRRLEIVNIYNEKLKDVVTIPEFNPDSSWHLYVIKTFFRNELMLFLKDKGIDSGVHYKPIHLHSCYNCDYSLLVAEKVWHNILTLPLFPSLTDAEIDLVVDSIKEFWDNRNCT